MSICIQGTKCNVIRSTVNSCFISPCDSGFFITQYLSIDSVKVAGIISAYGEPGMQRYHSMGMSKDTHSDRIRHHAIDILNPTI